MQRSDLDYSAITDNLFVGVTPGRGDYAVLRGLDVRLVINMRAEYYAVSSHWRGGIRTLWVPTIDWWLFPIRPWYVLWAARRAAKVLAEGGKVYCHCRKGKHRSVLMAACILITQGYAVHDAMAALKAARAVADPEIPHIYRGIVAFERTWQRTRA